MDKYFSTNQLAYFFSFNKVHPIQCLRGTQGRELLNELCAMNVREGNRQLKGYSK